MKKLNNIKILTTDAQSRIGLHAIRYLGRAGATVTSIGTGKTSSEVMGFCSKYVDNNIFFHADTYSEEFGRFLKEDNGKYDIICPIFTSSINIFLDIIKNEHIKSRYLLPKKQSLLIADNKELLTKHAQDIGLLCPKTYYNIDPNVVGDLARYDISFPAIIKFRGDKRDTHWNPEDRYSIVNSKTELINKYAEMHDIEEYPIIQEYISGVGCGYFALYDQNSTLKAQFCHKRIREYPISGGPSSCCESFRNEELIKIGKKLFDSLEWSGLGMVEFKYDISREKFYIIEVNPRYWGSLSLAVLSGVDFPVLHALLALGNDFKPVLDWKKGVKVRFFNKDILSILSHIKNEKRMLSKARLVCEIFNPKLKDGLMIVNDPKPILSSIFNRR